MFSKSTLLAFVLLSRSVAEGKQNAHGPENIIRGLSINEFMKAFEDSVSIGRGNKAGRRLQRVPIRESTSKAVSDLEITEDTLKQIFSELTKGKDGQKGAYDSCEDLFMAFDADKDGILVKSELIALYEKAGYTLDYATRFADALLQFYDDDSNGLNQREFNAVCKGDPHFVTWYGNHYSYHGACDLVLVQNPSFASGKGLDLHVRTEHMMDGAFSFVSNAALRIGNEVFEVASDGSHLLNGVLNAQLPARVGGYVLTKFVGEMCKGTTHNLCSDVTSFNVALPGNDAIRFKVASNMVHVDVKGSIEGFTGSSGLMGTLPALHHGKIARDGVTFLRETDVFAEEWQVREDEPKLFQHSRYPQFPQTCVPAVQPFNAERSLSDVENSEARLAAEEACSHVMGAEWEFCIFDVMATGDYGMAASIYGEN